MLWICTLQFFVVEAVVEAGWITPYDRMTYYISDLGALHCSDRLGGHPVCSPWHAGMNASFVVQGVLIASGALLLKACWPRTTGTRSSWVTTFLLLTAGCGVALVGLVPEDTVRTVHVVSASANFVAGNAALVGVWVLLRGAGGPLISAAALWSGLLGAVGLTALVSLALGAQWDLGAGGIERAVAYPLPAALPVVGFAVLGTRTSRPRRAGSAG